MKILFIKFNNIGDALIMTPALSAARALWPDAQIDVLVRGPSYKILKGSLAIDNIYNQSRPHRNRERFSLRERFYDIRLVSKLRKQKYDYVFELGQNDRGRINAILMGAKHLVTNTAYRCQWWAKPFFKKGDVFYWKHNQGHRCQMDMEALRASCGYEGPDLPMSFDRSFVDWSWVQKNVKTAPIVLQPTTRWKRKMWSVANWQKLASSLIDRAPVVVSCGPEPEEQAMAREIASVAPSRITITEGLMPWDQMAGLLYSARMLVSVDTAAMHLGSACGVPMVALFGPTPTDEWGPWHVDCEIVTPSMPESGEIGDRRLYNGVTTQRVLDACDVLWERTQGYKPENISALIN